MLDSDGEPLSEGAPPPPPSATRAEVAAVTGVWLGLVGLLLVVALGRTLRAPPALLVVLVTFLPFEFLLLGLFTAGVWARWRVHRLPPLALTAQLVLAMTLWGPGRARPVPESGEPLRVMSWNVQRLWGEGGTAGEATSCVARAIEEARPDVVTLLELSAEELADLEQSLGLRCVHTPYRGGGSLRQGGLATCVRGDRWQLRSGQVLRFVDDEDWFYVFTEVERDHTVVNVLAVHLYPYEVGTRRMRERLRRLSAGDPTAFSGLAERGADTVQAQANQSRALLDRVARFEDPTVVAGDFNSVRDLSLHVSLRAHLADTWEQAGQGSGATVWFLDSLPLRVDYVYASDRMVPASAWVPSVSCSDHRPVVAEMRAMADQR